MITQGTVPTLSVDEVREALEEAGLRVEKTRNKRSNLGWTPELALAMALNSIIISKADGARE